MTEPSPPPRLRYSGLAVVSLILGGLSLLWFWLGIGLGICGFVAAFAGRRARKEIDLAPYDLEGRALATSGIVLGALGFATAIFLLIIVLGSAPV